MMLEQHFDEHSKYIERNGVAKDRGVRNQCKRRLYFYSTDKALLTNILYDASMANDCYEVRLQKDDRMGIHVGYSVFTNESSLGDAWARYEMHPQVWIAIHDSEFCDGFRERIRNY
jgi:hypothetical protein